MQLAEMTHKEKVGLFLVGTMDELRKEGLITGGMELTLRGREMFLQLKEEDFSPSEEEIRTALAEAQRFATVEAVR